MCVERVSGCLFGRFAVFVHCEGHNQLSSEEYGDHKLPKILETTEQCREVVNSAS